MAIHVIKRGLDLPITGAPEQTIEDVSVTRVAVMAQDFPLMKPRMHCVVGDEVKRGQLLFDDRKAEGVRFTSPGAGRVVAVNRGDRRVLVSVVIELNERERSGETTEADHQAFEADASAGRELLVESGMWTAVRARPFDRVPSPTETCEAVFVTAIDTRPLAADPDVVVAGREADWKRGLELVATLTEGPVFLCRKQGSKISAAGVGRVREEDFSGKHPAGLVGTHIHLLKPVNRAHPVWYVGYQDVLRIGRLLGTGRLDVEHVVALGGPVVKSPKLLRTRTGASVDELTGGRLADGENRVVAGSPLYGRKTAGEEHGYIGRFHDQISALAEDRERHFLGWLGPGADMFTTVRAFLAGWFPNKKRAFTTTTHGSHRAMVPIGMFERVVPLDIMPTFLLRALLMNDISRCERLGVLELGEEDLSLCSFVSPGKEDYAPVLRRNLETIWKEG